LIDSYSKHNQPYDILTYPMVNAQN